MGFPGKPAHFRPVLILTVISLILSAPSWMDAKPSRLLRRIGRHSRMTTGIGLVALTAAVFR